MLEAIDAGAEDVQAEDDVIEIFTDPKDYDTVKTALENKGYAIAASEVTFIPDTEIEVEEEKRAKIERLIDSLEELDDVQEVYHNLAD